VDCVPRSRLVKLRGTKLRHFAVCQCSVALGTALLSLSFVPKLKSVKNRFRAIHGRRLYLIQTWSGWVTGDVLAEWGEWVWPVAGRLQVDPRVGGARSSPVARQGFNSGSRRGDAGVSGTQRARDPASPTSDRCSASGRPLLGEAVQGEAHGGSETLPREAEGRGSGFPRSGADIRRASEKQRVRIRMLFAIWEASIATTVLSSAGQGFWPLACLRCASMCGWLPPA
jgi:hypothetical protein